MNNIQSATVPAIQMVHAKRLGETGEIQEQNVTISNTIHIDRL